jgi:hypothetical protein
MAILEMVWLPKLERLEHVSPAVVINFLQYMQYEEERGYRNYEKCGVLLPDARYEIIYWYSTKQLSTRLRERREEDGLPASYVNSRDLCLRNHT